MVKNDEFTLEHMSILLEKIKPALPALAGRKRG